MAVYYDGQVLTNQIAYGLLGHSIIAWLKKTSWVPFINKHSWWINRGLALTFATLSAVGINYSYSYSADGVFVLTLSGLTLSGLWNSLLQWLVAYGSQQLPYHLTRTAEDRQP